MPLYLKNNTINEFHKKTVESFQNRPFLYFVDEDPISYSEYEQRVELLRKFLIQSGLKKGDRVSILGPASPNWAISFMAVMTAGMVSVPIMEDFPIADIEHIISDSGSRACMIDPGIMKRYNMETLADLSLFSLKDFSKLQDLDMPYNKEDASIFLKDPSESDCEPDEHFCYTTSPEDIAELLYTSGTTGHSKAVLLTHNNLVTNLYEGTDLIDACFDENTILLSLLPMAHSYGSTSAFLSIMYKGPRICFLKRKPTPEYLQKVLGSVKPTVLGGVPLIFEKIYQKKILPIINGNRFLKKSMIFPPFRKLFHYIAGRSILQFFGGKIKCIIIGGATFSKSVETFMKEGKIPYVLGYGLTETSPLLTFSSLKNARFGSVGHAVRNTGIRIVNKDSDNIGEIEVTGPQIMKGYYKKPEETAAVFSEDGWFQTGDRGFLDKDGYLYIKGRSKNVIVGNSGENIYPEVIETLLNSYPAIEESLVFMKDETLQALVYPGNYESDKNITAELEEIRRDINKRLPSASRLNILQLQEKEFIKTPTKKIKRAFYIDNY